MDCGTHLLVASGHSARYGASHPRDLVQRTVERGVGTLALTDRDTVTGAVGFARHAAPPECAPCSVSALLSPPGLRKGSRCFQRVVLAPLERSAVAPLLGRVASRRNGLKWPHP